MTLSKKLITSLILAPALFLSVAQGQTKKYINFLRTDTLGGKVSINVPYEKAKLDSLIDVLRKDGGNSTKDIFFKHNLSKQKFVVAYNEYIIKDDLGSAKQLIESGLKSDDGKKETIFGDRKLYLRYKKDLAQRYLDQDNRLFELLQKKRLFKKKFKELTDPPSLEAYQDSRDLAIRCKDYAKRNHLHLPSYVGYYGRYSNAKVLDEQTDFDLEKASMKTSFFKKTLKPYFESEDLDEYMKAANFLDSLDLYLSMAPKVKLSKQEFKRKKYELIRLIRREKEYLDYDSLAKEGNKYGVAQFRNDSLNPEGIFEFNGDIVVIINFNSQYQNARFIQGNGVEKADKFLVRYADANDNSDKHQKANEIVRGGRVLPYFIDGRMETYFNGMYDYQIRVSYDMIRSKRFTRKIKNTLRPIDVDTNYYGLVNEFYEYDTRVRFYRNKEGSFVQIYSRDSTILISEYDDDKNSNTDEGDHFIDKVKVVNTEKRKPVIQTYEFNLSKGVSEDQQPIFEMYSKLFNKYYNSSKRFF